MEVSEATEQQEHDYHIHQYVAAAPEQSQDEESQQLRDVEDAEAHAVAHMEQLEQRTRTTTADLPIVRTNTPRLAPAPDAFANSQRVTTTAVHETIDVPPFPTKPPSAPPVPEADARFDVIEKSKLPPAIYPLPEEIAQPVLDSVGDQQKGSGRRHVETYTAIQQSAMQDVVLNELQSRPQDVVKTSYLSSQLNAFAVYILCLLLCLLVFACVQGLGLTNGLLSSTILLLNVPWIVLVYGLLGGCVSCLVTLGRYRPVNLPGFVIVTWYARPFVAGVLAMCAYLLLNSGVLLSVGGGDRHQDVALLLGLAAGLCEGWLFVRRKERA